MKNDSKHSHRHGRDLGRIERDVLGKLSFGDLLFGYLLSAGSTARMFKLARERTRYRYRRKCAIERLVERDFIRKNGEKLSITTAGNNALGRTVEKTRKMLGAKRWDCKWRIAIFDIPEIYAPLRRKVRQTLKRAGFVQLQQSVWIFPHDCAELIQLIKQESRLSQFILYGVLEHIESEERLKKLFRLDS